MNEYCGMLHKVYIFCILNSTYDVEFQQPHKPNVKSGMTGKNERVKTTTTINVTIMKETLPFILINVSMHLLNIAHISINTQKGLTNKLCSLIKGGDTNT